MAAVALTIDPNEEPADFVPVEKVRRRPKSLGLKPLMPHEQRQKEIDDADPEIAALRAQRPRTRGDCVGGPRPCPWVSCAHHLALHVTPAGAAKVMFPDGDGGVDFDIMAETCTLDVADRLEELSLIKTAELMGLTQARVHQVDGWARRKTAAEFAAPAAGRRTGRPGPLPRKTVGW